MKTLVLGLGNPFLTDDGVGVQVVQSLKGCLPAGECVDLAEVSVGGLELMETMIGYDRVILIDAFQTKGTPPGTIRRLTLGDLQFISPTQHIASPHDASLITAIEAGQRLGFNLPKDIIIYAIAAKNIDEFGEDLTPEISAAVPIVVSAVLDELLMCKISPDP